jgi:hypothetical protein
MASNHDRFSYDGLYDYLRTIATKNKAIQSFAERDHEDILVTLGKGVNLPAMVVDPPEAGKIDMLSSNTQDAWSVTFEILKARSTKSSSPDTVRSMISSCKVIADQVLSYLRRESQYNRLPGFRTADIAGRPVIYESDGFIGWETEISIFVPIDLSFKPDNWDL